MYLTRVHLNPRRTQTTTALRNPQVLHAAVLAGMPSQPVTQETGRILWRVDCDNPYRPCLFVLSPERPDMHHLVEQYGWPTADSVQFESREYEPVIQAAAEGSEFSFRLTANPTHSGRAADGATKRYGHVTVAQQTQWLITRAPTKGFLIVENRIGEPALELRNRERISFRRDGQKVTLTRVTYEGRLAIVDQEAFRDSLLSGIGRAKAYGCGLLTLAP